MLHVGEWGVRLRQAEVEALGVRRVYQPDVDCVLEVAVSLPELGPALALGGWDHDTLN